MNPATSWRYSGGGVPGLSNGAESHLLYFHSGTEARYTVKDAENALKSHGETAPLPLWITRLRNFLRP